MGYSAVFIVSYTHVGMNMIFMRKLTFPSSLQSVLPQRSFEPDRNLPKRFFPKLLLCNVLFIKIRSSREKLAFGNVVERYKRIFTELLK